MSGFKYICKVAEAYPYDYEQPPICKVELWDFSRANECEEARIEAVTTVASISYGNEQAKNPEKLYKLLIEKDHQSPFEFVKSYVADLEPITIVNLRQHNISTWKPEKEKSLIATFKLKVPIFVARQIMRHRSFSYMEMSRRYVKDDKVKFRCWIPLGVRMGNKLCADVVIEDFYDYFEGVVAVYRHLLERRYKPEQARAFLPLGLYTQFWMQGDYRAWLNFFIHRLAPETQEETRLVAQAMWDLLKEHQPEIVDTMKRYLHIWVKECNHMFIPARERKAEWFKENLL